MTALSDPLNRAFDTVIFDLDGTLVDSLPGIEYSLHQALADVAPGENLPEVQTMIGPPVREMFRLALPDTNEATLGELERAFRRSYDEKGYLKTTVYDGIPKILSLLTRAGVKLYIATNKPPEAARRILKHLDLNTFFVRVVSTGDWLPSKRTKSDATAWLVEQERIDCDRCAFVGDSLDDAEAARTNLIAFYAAAYGYGRVVTLPGDVTLTAPDALAEMIFSKSILTAAY